MRIAIVLALVALAIPLAGAQILPGSEPAATGSAASVTVKNFAFVDSATGRSETVVHMGDTVTWTWALYQAPHSATEGLAPGAPSVTGPAFDSGVHTMDYDPVTGVYSAHTYSHTFTTPGVYRYFCAVHPSMTGTVIVTP